jgi:DNA primase
MNVLSILEQLGIEVVGNNKGELSCRCPWHDDKAPSLFIREDDGLVNCFAGCVKGTIVDLVAKSKGINRDQAVAELVEMKVGDIASIKKRLGERKEEDKKPIVYDEAFFKEHDIVPARDNEYLLNRGFTNEIIEEWGLMQGTHGLTILIPYMFEGKQVGMIFNHTLKDVPKYEITPFFKASDYLFGYDKLQVEEDMIILVEGLFDCIWAHQAGIHNVLALGGSNLTTGQEKILLKKCWRIGLCLDNDEPGRRAHKLIRRRLINLGFIVKDIKLPDGVKDIQELDLETVNKLLKLKI